jgi:hypothetical protein
VVVSRGAATAAGGRVVGGLVLIRGVELEALCSWCWGGCGGEEGRWVGGEGEIGEMVWYRDGKQQQQQL